MMRHFRNIILVGLAAAGMAAVVYGLPPAWIQACGRAWAPDGIINEASFPLWRKLLATSMGVLAGVLAGIGLYGAALRRGLPILQSQLKSEIRQLWLAGRHHWRQLTRSEKAVLFFLTGIGAGIRLWYLNQPMRFDEATTILLYARSPWYVGLVNYSSPNNHLLNTLLVHWCIRIGDEREWIVRLPALAAGLLTLPVLYFYARRFYSKAVAWLALGWVTVSLPFVDMATNARGYSWVALGGLVAYLCLYYILRRGYVSAAILHALAIGSGLLAVPVAMLFVLGGLVGAAWLGLYLKRTKQLAPKGGRLYWGSLFGGGALAFIGYAPILLILGLEALLRNQWVYPLSWPVFFQRMPFHLNLYLQYSLFPLSAVLVGVAAIGVAVYLVCWKKIEKYPISFPLAQAGVCFLWLLLNRRYPYWSLSLVWMILTALGMVAAAGGLVFLLRRGLKTRTAAVCMWGAPALALLGAVSLLRHNPRQTMDPRGGLIRPDIEAVSQVLVQKARPGDEILATSAAVVYQYYALRLGCERLNWSWNGQGPRQVFVLETPYYDECYRAALGHRLADIGLKYPQSFELIGEISEHRIWKAEAEQ